MILAILLALLGVPLVAAGTPRQAAMLFGDRFGRSGRRALRLAGLACLAASLYASLRGDDRARHFIACLGAIEVVACAVALMLTVRAGSPRP